MSDRYQIERDSCDSYIWECDENGRHIKRFLDDQDIVDELNRLERLVTDSVNMARLEERTKVQHAMLKQNIKKHNIDSMSVVEEGPITDIFVLSQFVTVRRDYWNRMVRALKSISELAFLP
jgi:hypothetical protein